MPIAYPYKMSDWYGYDKDCTSTTSFSMSRYSDLYASGACTNALNWTRYSSDSNGYYPGAIVYTDAAGQNPLNGGWDYYKAVYNGSNVAFQVSYTGVMSSPTSCI